VRFGVIENIDFRGKMRDKEHAFADAREEVWNLDILKRWSKEVY
jgi:hypothetical protein